MRVVDRVTTQQVEHGIEDCVGRVLASPVACTVLLENLLANLTDERRLWDPKWARTVYVAVRLGSTLGYVRTRRT
ncbi:hypothetical protein [Georgenia muralis]